MGILKSRDRGEGYLYHIPPGRPGGVPCTEFALYMEKKMPKGLREGAAAHCGENVAELGRASEMGRRGETPEPNLVHRPSLQPPSAHFPLTTPSCCVQRARCFSPFILPPQRASRAATLSDSLIAPEIRNLSCLPPRELWLLQVPPLGLWPPSPTLRDFGPQRGDHGEM